MIEFRWDEYYGRLEEVCRISIEHGTCGVMVENFNCWIDERVPYGYIWDAGLCGE